LKLSVDSMFEEEPKARCPECNQSLTFVRTKSHEKRWYCYGCEKYVDHTPQAPFIKDAHARLESLSGLQVVDSHGILVGRVRKAIPLLDDRDLSREFEVSHDEIATVGDVVILSDVFSPSALAPARPSDTIQGARLCGKCGAQLLQGAKHCIKCGSLLESTDCPTCRTMNPIEAKFCKNCGNKIS